MLGSRIKHRKRRGRLAEEVAAEVGDIARGGAVGVEGRSRVDSWSVLLRSDGW